MLGGLDDWTMTAGDPRRFMWIEVMIVFPARFAGEMLA